MRRRDFYWSLYYLPEKKQLDNLRTDQIEAVFSAVPEIMQRDYFVWRDGFDNWKPFFEFPELLIGLRKVEDAALETPPPPQLKSSAQAGGTTVLKPSAASASSAARVAGKSSMKPSAQKPVAKSEAKATPGTSKSKTKTDFQTSITRDAISNPGFEEDIGLTLMDSGPAEDRDNFRITKKFDLKISMGEKTFSAKTLNVSLKGMQLEKALPKNMPRYFNVEISRNGRGIPLLCSEIRNADGSPSSRIKIEVNNYTSGLLELLLSAG